MLQNKLVTLATERSNPCVTISMKTHRTHPDNAKDVIRLKNLLTEAKDRVINEFGKRDVNVLLQKIDNLDTEINPNYNLDSLHIFISNSTKKIVRSPLQTQNNGVHISSSFAIKPLIKLVNQTQEYYILLLSQSGVKLLHATNDTITEEIKNDDFPFLENHNYLTDKEKLSDGKQVDNMVREYFNVVDKAMLKVYNSNELNCVVIATEDNYSRLLQVADKPSIYYGYSNINYNDTSNKTIGTQAWSVMKEVRNKTIKNAVDEMGEAAGQEKAISSLPEIFRAVKEGRGDLLIIDKDYHQPVKMRTELTFDLIKDVTKTDAIDDIVSEIAWEVMTKEGRVLFADKKDLKSLGDITLKVRY